LSDAITVIAPAKINVTLEVVARLPNGYHRIRSVMLRLPRLADSVSVRVTREASGIRIGSDSSEIPADETNICHRAAARYLECAGETARVEIDIRKAIPVAAGLGGGSSDAAAVLLALNRHFGQRITARRLAAIGSDVGKDVPFFLAGADACHASGMGEVVRAIPGAPRGSCLVVNPRIAISTRVAYEALARDLWFMECDERVDRSRRMVRAITAGDFAAMAAALYNDFEVVAERMHPVVRELRQALLALGARGALMSGSGPTVFGLFESRAALARAADLVSARYPTFVVARG
jgi:4-diphosphocytidyl-2-C-methyl-D-erythritol kinase